MSKTEISVSDKIHALPIPVLAGNDQITKNLAYRQGHRDARNQAAEIAGAEVEQLQRRIEELEAENAKLRTIDDKLGFWLSAALSDPEACDKFKADVEAWFESRAERPSEMPEVIESQVLGLADGTRIPPGA